MCFGGKGGGGNQGGGSSQEDGEVRKAHREAGISAADTRRYFREKENPAHMRNKNAPGGTTSVSHSRDDGGNLVAKQVDYGQGSFAPPLGEREGDQSLAMNQQKAIRRDFIRDNKFLPDQSSLSDNLVAQNLSRTNTYKPQSDLFINSTPEQIEAIRAANRAKDPRDQDGDGSWLTSTDNMGRVAGIGTTGDGSGSQPYIYDPYLPEGYRGIPQVDPNRGADTNLTMFGKAMRKVGGPIVANMMGPLAPVAGAMLLANKYPDKVPSFLTGKGTYAPTYDEPIGPNRPSTVAPPTREFKSYVDSRDLNLGSLGGISPETNNIGASSNGALPTETYSTSNINRPILRPTGMNVNTGTLSSAPKGMTNYEDRNLSSFSPIPLEKRMTDDLSDAYLLRGYNPPIDKMMPPSTTGSLDPTRGDRIRFRRNNQQYIDMGARGEPMKAGGYVTEPDATNYIDPSRFVNYAFNETGSNDNDSPDIRTTQNTTSDNVASPYFNYKKWTPSEPTYLGTSSYGGKWSTGASGVASTAPVGIYSSGDPSAQVLTDFYNDKTGQYYTAPNASFYAEAGSDWKRGRPTSSYA